jgi:replication factor C subunit 1
LDEIDGMSVGDKGGLSELIEILKRYSGDNAIVCISNEWLEKKFHPFKKICEHFEVSAPSLADVQKLLEAQFTAESKPADLPKLAADLLEVHNGDLRKILQSVQEIQGDMVDGKIKAQEVRETIEIGLADAHALGSNRIRRADTIKSAVGQLLRGSLDMTAEVPLNNNDLNLAGLHLHETLPTWIKKYMGNNETGYNMYKSTFQTILASDRLDYYTFFFQHWTLFPLTYQAKLQNVNIQLFGRSGVADGTSADWDDESMKYTAVLAKQSMLYNQFRYLCEMRDLFVSENVHYDAGFDSTFWRANLFLVAARDELKKPETVGFGKKVGAPIWENSEYWRGALPRWMKSADTTRFMRLLQALDIPSPALFGAV